MLDEMLDESLDAFDHPTDQHQQTLRFFKVNVGCNVGCILTKALAIASLLIWHTKDHR